MALAIRPRSVGVICYHLAHPQYQTELILQSPQILHSLACKERDLDPRSTIFCCDSPGNGCRHGGMMYELNF